MYSLVAFGPVYTEWQTTLWYSWCVCCCVCVCGPMGAHPCCEMLESVWCNFKCRQDLVLAGVCELQLSSVCITEVTVCQLTATNWLQLRSSIYTDYVCRSSVAAMYVRMYIRTYMCRAWLSQCCSSMAKCHSQLFFSLALILPDQVGKLPVDVLIPLQPHYLTHYGTGGWIAFETMHVTINLWMRPFGAKCFPEFYYLHVHVFKCSLYYLQVLTDTVAVHYFRAALFGYRPEWLGGLSA